MGNVKYLLGATGTGLEKYTYDAFGQPKITDWNGALRSSSAYANRFMFSGREFFSSLAIYDLRNRAYDPALGAFLQIDPIGFEGDPSNMFRFCGNAPLLGGDPSGLGGISAWFTATWNSFTSSINWFDGSPGSHSSGYNSAVASGNVNYNPFGLSSDTYRDNDFGGSQPWGYYATSNLAFGPILLASNTAKDAAGTANAPQGTFTITARPGGSSFTVFTITYDCPTCVEGSTIVLDQYMEGLRRADTRGNPVEVWTGFQRDFGPGRQRPLADQKQDGSRVVAHDRAGMRDTLGSQPGSGIPVQRVMQAMATFKPYNQTMRTYAIEQAKDNGSQKVLGMWEWGASYKPNVTPIYTGIGAHAAVAPNPGYRFP